MRRVGLRARQLSGNRGQGRPPSKLSGDEFVPDDLTPEHRGQRGSSDEGAEWIHKIGPLLQKENENKAD